MDRRRFNGALLALPGLMFGLPEQSAWAAVRAGPSERGRFVTKDPGGALKVGARTFRYIGANMSEVTHIRTDWNPTRTSRFRLPTRDELDWIVEAAAQGNFQVIRTWCFPSHLQPELPESVHYFHRNTDGRTVTLNEDGFVLFDYFLARCRELGVRAQVPFVYLYQPKQWADGRGDPHPQLLDFVNKVVNRRNTLTGEVYRDDPTIYCWESGNEATPTVQWIRSLAAFTKSVDSKHLFMDGRWGPVDTINAYERAELRDDANIDIVSFHNYQPSARGWTTPETITNIHALLRKQGKALDIGEIGPSTDIAALSEILARVVSDSVAGASWWSFKGARAAGGYTQWNSTRYGGNDDLKWPGFVSDLPGVAREKAKIDLLCEAAYAINGAKRPTRLPAPTPAKLLPIADTGHISWIPGTGEQTADLQRSPAGAGKFTTVLRNIETFKGSAWDLACDETAVPGDAYDYRVVSRNTGGAARPSNVVGPVVADGRWLVDDLWSLSKTSSASGCAIESNYDLVPYHADLSVLKSLGSTGHITYGLEGVIDQILIVANGEAAAVSARGLGPGAQTLDLRKIVLPPAHDAFAGQPRVLYRARSPEAHGLRGVRIDLGPSDVLSRVEIRYR